MLTCATALAAPTGSEDERTRLYQQGKALADAGDYAGAATKFRAVISMRSAPKALIALAIVEEKQGHFLAARILYRQASSDASKPGAESDRAAAEAGLARVEGNLARIDVRIAGATSNVHVAIDETAASPGESEVDPGEHRVSVRSDGYAPFETTVVVGAKERRVLNVSLTPVGTTDVLAARPIPWAPIVVAGTGIATGVGGYLLLSAGLAERDNRKEQCLQASGDATRCPSSLDSVPTGASKIIAGDILLGVGAAATIVGGVWLGYELFRPREALSARVRPVLSATPHEVSFTVSGAF